MEKSSDMQKLHKLYLDVLKECKKAENNEPYDISDSVTNFVAAYDELKVGKKYNPGFLSECYHELLGPCKELPSKLLMRYSFNDPRDYALQLYRDMLYFARHTDNSKLEHVYRNIASDKIYPLITGLPGMTDSSLVQELLAEESAKDGDIPGALQHHSSLNAIKE